MAHRGLSSTRSSHVPSSNITYQSPSCVSLRRGGVSQSKHFNEVIVFACEMPLEANILLKEHPMLIFISMTIGDGQHVFRRKEGGARPEAGMTAVS